MIIEVKEFKGLATNADPNDIGLEFSRINTNFSLDRLGTLTKQKGRGSHTDLSGIRVSQLQYWSPSNLDTSNAVIPAVWVGFDATNNKIKRLNNDFSSPTDLGSAVTASSVVDLNDHGQDFRIATDNLANPPKILQHISRKFFTNNYTVNEYVFQNAQPNPIASEDIHFISLNEIESEPGLALTVNQLYNYQISAVYDGTQELPLSDSFKSLTIASGNKGAELTIEIPATNSGTAPNKTYSFNPRITSLKIYRANSLNYFQIGEIPINTNTDNKNIIYSTSTYKKGDESIYSDSFIGTDMINADNILGTKTEAVTAGLKSFRYFISKNNYTAYNDILANGHQISAIVPQDRSDGTFPNVPANQSTFTTNLAKGFINIDTDATGTFADFFNESFYVYRVLLDVAGGSTNTTIIKQLIPGGVCHSKAIIFHDVSNTDRYGDSRLAGSILEYSSNNYVITASIGKAILLKEATASFSGNLKVFDDYHESFASNKATYKFYDFGRTNGIQAPFVSEQKVKVNYKYSQMIGNIHFVGNVKLDPGGLDETHPDFVMYSEFGMPDVIPISNFIAIKDQQGGSIIGMNRILNNLVVFMTRGIFRLDVSSGDPSLFTLLEVNTGIGCVAPESIVNAQDNLFFCSKDNIYQIRPDFTFIAISKSIEDTYQGITNISSSKIIYDIKRDRLICTLGNDHTNIYMYDLNTQEWTKLNFDDSSFRTANFFTVNDDLDLFTVDVYDNNPSP